MYLAMETFNVKVQVLMPSGDGFNSAVMAAEKGNCEPLRSLCREEVERFEAYLKKSDPWFAEGLVPIEQRAIEGYLYQKLRGHMDAPPIKGLPG